ncbi:hypothetical protein KI387_038382, partial [Taxus chinensis]
MVSTSGRIDVENFFHKKFEMWKLKMENMLLDRYLWDAVDEKVYRPMDPVLAAPYDVMDRKAKGLIRLCLANSILINVHEESTLEKLWKNL